MSKKEAKGSGGLLAKKGLAPVLIILSVLVYGVLGYFAYTYWLDSREVFRDVTVELGTESLSIRDFLTAEGRPERARFVSDPSVIDLGKLGTTEIRLKHGTEEYTVTLTVQDTIAPTANIETARAVSVSEPLPAARDLVSNVQDLSQVQIYYAEPPVISEDYSPISPVVVVEDAAGNKLEGACEFTFAGWVKESVTLELGMALTADLVLTDPEKDAAYLDQDQMDAIAAGGVGTHEIVVNTGGAQGVCLVTIQDTTAPALRLQPVRRYPGETADVSEFIVSATDASGDPQVRLVSDGTDYTKQGKYTVTIEAEDTSGNVTKGETTLFVSNNLNPPEIKGASKEISMEKNTTPDFLAGVTASDDIDKNLKVTVDTSGLDAAKAGTYYITYYATDNSGNTGSYKRKVIVEPDAEDTAALVKQTAATLPNDPEAIRDYVHDLIAYGSSWGGDDPVWHGLTTNSGNCMVHAKTLKALLDEKGYETQLIWVTNESHYWLIIKLDEGWRHIDSTPSAQHEKIGLATDKVRYQNLNGRDWDRSKWPACN